MEFIKKYLRFDVPLVILSLILLSSIVYWPYITLQKLYIFNDIGSDTYFQNWPLFTLFWRSLHSGLIPTWSFTVGLGQNVFHTLFFDPFNFLLYIVPLKMMPYMLVYVQILKVVVAGTLFYLFLKTYGLSRYVSYIGALCYAFSGVMIARGTWYIFSTECVVLAFVLLATELWMRKRIWWLLPVALAFVCSIALWPVYYMPLYCLYIGGYALFRWFTLEKKPFTNLFQMLLRLAGACLLGIGISAVIWLPTLYSALHSTRLAEDSQIQTLLGMKPWQLDNWRAYAAVFLRTLSSDAMGNGSGFKGWINYLESPLFYCGLLVVIFLPSALFDKKKLRWPQMLVLGIAALYLGLPFIRSFFNGFAGDYFRASSLWIQGFMIIFAMAELQRVLNDKKSQRWLPILTGSGIVVLLLVLQFGLRFYMLEKNVIFSICIFLAVYCAILLRKKLVYTEAGKALLLVVVVCELVIFSYTTVATRSTLSPKDLTAKTGYFDDTTTALNFIESIDSGVYRVEKLYDSVFLSDAAMQDYWGTKSYHSANNAEYIRFLRAKNIKPKNLPPPNYLEGFGERYDLNNVVGVKYYLAKNATLQPPNTKFVKRIGEVFIYKNSAAFPFGYIANPKSSAVPVTFSIASETELAGRINATEKGIVIFSIPYDEGWQAEVNTNPVKLQRAETSFIGIPVEKGAQSIRLRYRMPWVQAGAVVSLISLAVLVLFVHKKLR